jgi:hypothetical protein
MSGWQTVPGCGVRVVSRYRAVYASTQEDLPSEVWPQQSQGEEAGSGEQAARAIVQLGQAMGLATVAEGIETAEQAAVMRQLGCGFG